MLHISSSPRDAASDSLALAQAFLDSHQAVRPGVTIETVDLFDGSLPQFGRLAAGAKMAVFGIDDVTEIRWQPTVLTATRDEDRAAALERAMEAGRTF